MEAAGLKVWNISNNDNRNIEEITLNLPGRDQKIEWLQAIHPRYRQSRNRLHHLRTYGERHLVQQARNTRGGGRHRALSI